MHRLRGRASLAISVAALVVALGSGYALGKGFISTKDLRNQAVTNKKIKKDTIKGDRVDEASLSGAGTALSISEPTVVSVPAGTTTPKQVLSLQVPRAGSYVLIAKAVLAKGGTQTPVNCRLSAGGDSDRSLEDVNATNNTTILNTLAHTFAAPGAVMLACDDPDVAAQLLVTDIRISAIPVGALSNTQLP
jgi:hypothetical protein